MNLTSAQFSSVDIKSRSGIDLRAGDTVRVHQKVKERDGKTRIQIFEGLVLARKRGSETGATFTVRRIASGVGVEKTYPLYSPMIDKVEVVRRAKVRRAKLYHVRDKAAKEIRRQMRNVRTIAAASEKTDTKHAVEPKVEAPEAVETTAEAK